MTARDLIRPASVDGPDGPYPLLRIDDLRTYFFTDAGIVRAVDGVTFKVAAGEIVGIVGESGCGKSVTASSIMRLVAPPGRSVGGSILLNGRNVLDMPADDVRELRGSAMAMIFQDPMTSLNPVLRIATQLEEAMLAHRKYTRPQAKQRAIDLLGRMGVTAPDRAVRSYPYQFSGGMRQRVMLAMGFGNDPSLLIADEPTTALDVTVQAQILDLLRELNHDLGVTIILITHDLGVVADVCGRVIVMYAGKVVEEGRAEVILTQPLHPYTAALVRAVPRIDDPVGRRLVSIPGFPPDLLDPPHGCRFAARCPLREDRCSVEPPLVRTALDHAVACWVTHDDPARAVSVGEPVEETRAAAGVSGLADRTPVPTVSDVVRTPALELVGLQKHFVLDRGGFGRPSTVVHAVDDVDLRVGAGETVGLVGESGSGKSTLARLIVRLYDPTQGRIIFQGADITSLRGRQMRPFRRRIQMIFQDPYSSLNPRMSVGDILREPLLTHRIVPRSVASKRVVELLSLVGLEERAARKYPYEFSGGQRQRVGIARALAMEPEFIVADEPVSSLDVNIQAQVINLLEDLQAELSLTYLFIAHDLSVVRHVSDRIAVMYLGKIAEIGNSDDVVARSLHPYTKSLISAAPIPDPTAKRFRERTRLEGEIPSPINPPSGCRFRTRCPLAQHVCATDVPAMREIRPGHAAACHFAEA